MSLHSSHNVHHPEHRIYAVYIIVYILYCLQCSDLIARNVFDLIAFIKYSISQYCHLPSVRAILGFLCRLDGSLGIIKDIAVRLFRWASMDSND